MLNFKLGVKSPQGRELIAPFFLSVQTNDKIAIIGEEGNGKSLCFKALIQHPQIQSLHIDCQMSNPDILFGYFSQELESPTMTIRDFLIGTDWQRYATLNRYLALHLPHFNEDDLDRTLQSLSGGEKVKVKIINLLLSNVDIYLLDEPSNDLDIPTLQWLEDWIKAQSKPVLFISHDVTLLESVANRVVHFEQTHRKTRSKITVYEGVYLDYIQKRHQHISNHNANVDNAKALKDKQMLRWRTMYEKVAHRQDTITRQNAHKGAKLKKKMKTIKAAETRFKRDIITDKIDSEAAINIHFDAIHFHATKCIKRIQIHDLASPTHILGGPYRLDIFSGDKIAIIGRNGVGKTTFLHQAFNDTRAFMHQDYQLNFDPTLNAIDNCAINHTQAERTMITTRLGSLKFTEAEMHQPSEHLSGGQKAKLSLLKLVLQKPTMIVLDEPTRNLSPLSVSVIYDMLHDYQGAIICVTHDRRLISNVFDTVYEFTEAGLHLISEDLL